METRYFELDKIIKLQELIDWLDDYTSPINVLHEVRVNCERNEELTQLLNELGKVNEKRNELLLKILNYK